MEGKEIVLVLVGMMQLVATFFSIRLEHRLTKVEEALKHLPCKHHAECKVE